MTAATQSVGAVADEQLTQDIASRLRAEIAGKRGKRITQTAIARATGIPQQSVSARMRGEVPFSVAQMVKVCEFAEVDLIYVLTGKRTDLTDWYPSRSGDRSARLLGKNRRPKAPFVVPVIHPRDI